MDFYDLKAEVMLKKVLILFTYLVSLTKIKRVYCISFGKTPVNL